MGPAFAAWCGWHDSALPGCPAFTGQAYIRQKGTQQAEYQTAIHGLSAALTYVITRGPAHRPARVRLHVDNPPVYLRMTGEWHAHQLARYHGAADELRGALLVLGPAVAIKQVSERDPAHKVSTR